MDENDLGKLTKASSKQIRVKFNFKSSWFPHLGALP